MRTENEISSEKLTANLFEACQDSTIEKLASFPKYVSRQSLTRFLSFYELYKIILPVEGSIVECGVFRGGGLMSWAKLSAILEPTNWKRQVLGFDTFEGFVHVSSQDKGTRGDLVAKGIMASNSYEELLKLVTEYDKNRFLGHMQKVQLIKGDVLETIPKFIDENRHIAVALLFLDFDLYDPTKVALEYFWPRMPRGSLVAFDDFNHPYWPGETVAVNEVIGIGNLTIRRLIWDSTICYAIKE